MGRRGLHDLIDREGYCRYSTEIVGSSIAYERLNFYRSHLLAMQKLLRYRASYNNCQSSARFDLLDLVGFGAFRPHMGKGLLLPIVKGKKIKDGKLHGYRLVDIPGLR